MRGKLCVFPYTLFVIKVIQQPNNENNITKQKRIEKNIKKEIKSRDLLRILRLVNTRAYELVTTLEETAPPQSLPSSLKKIQPTRVQTSRSPTNFITKWIKKRIFFGAAIANLGQKLEPSYKDIDVKSMKSQYAVTIVGNRFRTK